MIKHVVFCNFAPEATEQQRKEVIEGLKSLPGKIDVIRDLAVGPNVVQSKRAWDFALVASFDNLKDLDTYSDHPEHVPLKNKVAAISKDLGAVDFEY
jgi:hypothetical protein